MAKLVAHEGKGDELIAAFEDIFTQVDKEEGTEIYVLNRSSKEPEVFWFYELYTDRDALTAHGSSEAMAAAMTTLGPLMASSELIFGEPVRAKGVDI